MLSGTQYCRERNKALLDEGPQAITRLVGYILISLVLV
jgi:hypothetical protein